MNRKYIIYLFIYLYRAIVPLGNPPLPRGIIGGWKKVSDSCHSVQVLLAGLTAAWDYKSQQPTDASLAPQSLPHVQTLYSKIYNPRIVSTQHLQLYSRNLLKIKQIATVINKYCGATSRMLCVHFIQWKPRWHQRSGMNLGRIRPRPGPYLG